jgi:enoyl-CoA hydratase/carnithine racemase
MSNSLTVEEIDGSTIIRFTNPERRNPLTTSVVEELTSIVSALASLKELRRVIFTGSGDAFASGADLSEIVSVNAEMAEAFALRGQSLMDSIAGLRATSFAAVSGYCFGGALALALACDRRIASPSATFSHPGASLGIMTGWGGTQRLPRLVGEAHALEMFFTAKRVGAEEALAIGLVESISLDPVASALNVSCK